MDSINPKTSNTYIKHYNNEFPKVRDFFLLDYEENIKSFKTTNNKDPEYIFVLAENREKKIREKIFKRKDFLPDYDFIKVITPNQDVYINFIIPKKIFNNAREIRLLTEIKKRHSLMKEIKRKTQINLDTKNNIIFKEIFNVPLEQKFYNRMFTLNIIKQNSNQFQNYQNQINNNPGNNNNNIIINNTNFNNINQAQNNNIQNNNNIIINNNNNFNINNSAQNNSNTSKNFNLSYNIDNNMDYPENVNCGNYPNTQINNNNNINGTFFNNYNQYIYINNNTNNSCNNPNNLNTMSNQNYPTNNNAMYVNNNSQNPNNLNYNNNGISYQTNQNSPQNDNDVEMKDETGDNHQNNAINNSQNGANTPQYGQFPSQQGYNLPQTTTYPTQTGINNPQFVQNPSQTGFNNPQFGMNPSQSGFNNLQVGQNNQSQSGFNNLQSGTNPPQPGTNPSQPGINPPQPGTNPPQQHNYIFPKKGLRNIGSTCYMNATLQCLLHVSELITYFIDEYPRDLNTLIKINSNVQSGGDISRAFYNLINGVYDKPEYLSDSKKNLNLQTNQKKSSWNFFGSWGINNNNNSFAPDGFKRMLGLHNPQFRNFELNDPKDLILYLLQTMHEELNYFGNINKRLEKNPNQYNMVETYNYFMTIIHFNYFQIIFILI